MREIKLTQGMVALVDDEDFDRVNQFKWHASREGFGGSRFYAVRFEYDRLDSKKIKTKIRMHRFILNLPPGKYQPGIAVDHINNDPLDNRKENLRVITQTENMNYSNGWRKKKTECFL